MEQNDIEKKIWIWEQVLTVIKSGESTCICFAFVHIEGASIIFTNEELKCNYPELQQYEPKKYYVKRNGIITNYWWTPHSRSGKMKRIEVIKKILEDLKNQL